MHKKIAKMFKDGLPIIISNDTLSSLTFNLGGLAGKINDINFTSIHKHCDSNSIQPVAVVCT